MSHSIFKADLEKYKEEILHFWKNNFASWQQEKYSWFYENNPYGVAACWIAKETEKNMVIGSTAVFPRRFLIEGKYVLGGITGDFAMDKNYRFLGPALQLQKATLTASNENPFNFLYGYPNDRSEPVQRRVGFKIVGSTYRLVKVLKSNFYAGRYFTLPIIGKLFSRSVDLMLKALSKETYYIKRRNFNFELLTNFDERFDDLWKKASHHYTIIGERTSEFLNWRFTQCPYRKYRIFVLTQKGTEEIIGYVVYCVTKNSVRIVDLLAVDMDRYIDALLSKFLLFQRRKGIDSVSIIYLGNEDLVNKLKKYKFYLRENERKIVAYIDSRSPISSCLLNKKNWYLTEADND